MVFFLHGFDLFGSQAGRIYNAAIFLPDDREEAYDSPRYSPVQFLAIAPVGWCTTFFVSRDYALTAQHCVKHGIPRHIEIDRGGQRSAEIGIADSWQSEILAERHDSIKRKYYSADVTVLRLAELAPNDLGYFELATEAEVFVGQDAISVGYPNYTYQGKSRVKDAHCKVQGIEGDIIRTDCAMTEGNSGGPLLVRVADGSWKVAGIASTELKFTDGATLLSNLYLEQFANYYTNVTVYRDRILRDIRTDREKLDRGI